MLAIVHSYVTHKTGKAPPTLRPQALGGWVGAVLGGALLTRPLS